MRINECPRHRHGIKKPCDKYLGPCFSCANNAIHHGFVINARMIVSINIGFTVQVKSLRPKTLNLFGSSIHRRPLINPVKPSSGFQEEKLDEDLLPPTRHVIRRFTSDIVAAVGQDARSAGYSPKMKKYASLDNVGEVTATTT